LTCKSSSLPTEQRPIWLEKRYLSLKQSVLMDHGKVCDVCICCALWDEAKAVHDIFSELGRTGFEEDFTTKKVKYLKGSIQNDLGEALSVHLCWLPEMGPGRAAPMSMKEEE
jgi:hypothetical protein